MFGCRGEELGKVVIAVVLEVAADSLSVSVSLAVFGEIHRCGVGEQQEVIHPEFLSLSHEIKLSRLSCPVIRTVLIEETFGTACLILYITPTALGGTTRTDVHTPAGQSDALGIPVGIHILAE